LDARSSSLEYTTSAVEPSGTVTGMTTVSPSRYVRGTNGGGVTNLAEGSECLGAGVSVHAATLSTKTAQRRIAGLMGSIRATVVRKSCLAP
jgi:hypothetical protein